MIRIHTFIAAFFLGSFSYPLTSYSAEKDLLVPQLEWSEVHGAKQYDLQISRDIDFSRIAYQARLSRTTFRWEGVIPGYYYWRVTAVDEMGYLGEFGDPNVLEVTVSAPTHLSRVESENCGEMDQIPMTEVELTWDSHPLVASFDIFMADNPKFERQKLYQSFEPKVTVTPRRETTYYWRVQPRDSEGADIGPISETQVLKFYRTSPLRQLQVVQPAGEKILYISPNHKPETEIQWIEDPAAEEYELNLSADSNFSDVQRELTKEKSYKLEGMEEGDLFWRVRPKTSGFCGPWTQGRIRVFPNLSMPGNPQSSVAYIAGPGSPQTLTLSWDSVEKAQGYGVKIATDPLFEHIVHMEVLETTTFHHLLDPGRYYWQVKALNEVIGDDRTLATDSRPSSPWTNIQNVRLAGKKNNEVHVGWGISNLDISQTVSVSGLSISSGSSNGLSFETASLQGQFKSPWYTWLGLNVDVLISNVRGNFDSGSSSGSISKLSVDGSFGVFATKSLIPHVRLTGDFGFRTRPNFYVTTDGTLFSAQTAMRYYIRQKVLLEWEENDFTIKAGIEFLENLNNFPKAWNISPMVTFNYYLQPHWILGVSYNFITSKTNYSLTGSTTGTAAVTNSLHNVLMTFGKEF